MRNILTTIFIFLAVFIITDINAAKPTKKPICHLDSDTNTYKLLHVPDNAAFAAHLKHGDGAPGEGNLDENCNFIGAKEVFARVYRELGTNDQYDITDTLYVEVVDENNNGKLDIDDVVHVYALPTDTNGGTTSSIGEPNHSITGFSTGTNSLTLSTNHGPIEFNNNNQDFYSEGTGTFEDGTNSTLLDTFIVQPPEEIDDGADLIQIAIGSPSKPSPQTEVVPLSLGDDNWLEVRIYPLN